MEWAIEAADRHELSDSVSGRLYEIGVALPASYAATERHYPAVVVLDGNLCFGIASDVARLQAATGETAELIVIGIGTPRREGLAAYSLKRLRDLTPTVPSLEGSDSGIIRLLLARITAAGLAPQQAFGGADTFLAFLTTQMLPFLAARYRIDSEELGLFGHSAGGVFAMHALLTPGSPFTHFTAGSFPGSWLGDGVAARIDAFRHRDAGRHLRLYYGVGGAELDDEAIAPGLRMGIGFLERLAAPPCDGLDLMMRTYPDETHTSVMAALLSSAFRWHYSTGLSYSQAAMARASAVSATVPPR